MALCAGETEGGRREPLQDGIIRFGGETARHLIVVGLVLDVVDHLASEVLVAAQLRRETETERDRKGGRESGQERLERRGMT
jgi:hypothetical protein